MHMHTSRVAFGGLHSWACPCCTFTCMCMLVHVCTCAPLCSACKHMHTCAGGHRAHNGITRPATGAAPKISPLCGSNASCNVRLLTPSKVPRKPSSHYRQSDQFCDSCKKKKCVLKWMSVVCTLYAVNTVTSRSQ